MSLEDGTVVISSCQLSVPGASCLRYSLFSRVADTSFESPVSGGARDAAFKFLDLLFISIPA